MGCALRCRLCEHPSCTGGAATDIRGVMRRVAVGNFVGAKKCYLAAPAEEDLLLQYEAHCICQREDGRAVAIRDVIDYLDGVKA